MFEYIHWLTGDLSSYDPYDIWKTKMGMKVKSLYYKNKLLGAMPAFVLSFWDMFLNNKSRTGYQKQEYPMVRALAAKSLLNLYEVSRNESYLTMAREHFGWLIQNYSKGYSGFCWGHNMTWVSKNGVYAADTPFITTTPYVLEGLVQYQKITNDNRYHHVVVSIFDFISKDLQKHIDNAEILSLSYAPVIEPRVVINANSYALYSLSMLQSVIPEKSLIIKNDALRLYKFIVTTQNEDGSWWYYDDNMKGNFIDCFHTCFILKNLIKASGYMNLPDIEKVIESGYNYLLENFYDKKTGLFKRFSKSDRLGLVKFDLYDNAEVLSLAYLRSDIELYTRLEKQIKKKFVKDDNIFSAIDLFNFKKNRNRLRWATMPYIYALSQLEKS